MKLIRFKLNSRFRSLPAGFELVFRDNDSLNNEDLNQFHPYCFAGLNGSGKSNVLEALSLVFFYLECSFSKYLPDNFKESFEKKQSPFSFELEYLIYKYEEDLMIPISVSKQYNEDIIFERISKDGEHLKINTIPVREGINKSNAPAKHYLPEIVIGYSSGENEILSLPFLKTRLLHFDNYKQALVNGEEYDSNPLTSLVYVDYSLSQAVLLSNFLMHEDSDSEDTKKNVLFPIQNELNIEKLHSFRLVIREVLLKNETINSKSKGKELLSQLKIKNKRSIIDKLLLCSTCHYYSEERELILDFYVSKSTKMAFRNHFASSYHLFQDLKALLELNLHFVEERLKTEIYTTDSMYISEKMPKPRGEDLVFYFNNFLIKKKGETKPVLVKNLSDGEHQFLHSMGICLMLKDKTALLLLDEPETHFNPDWRSKFISILKDCLERGESNNLVRDIIITSHSPFIISDCFPDKVIVFEKNCQPQNAIDININTYGASVNLLTSKIFKKQNTIGKYSLNKLNEYRSKLQLKNADLDEIKEEINLLFGDSIEKLLLLKELQQIQNKDL